VNVDREALEHSLARRLLDHVCVSFVGIVGRERGDPR
jgi:hypothetical protein